MIRLVQLQGPGGRRLALVEEPDLLLLDGCSSVYQLAQACMEQKCGASAIIRTLLGKTQAGYGAVYAGSSLWKILPSVDHPDEPARWVSGTGLTHNGQREKPPGDARRARGPD
jgi:hypothetical protein